jgi:hypothetical protein
MPGALQKARRLLLFGASGYIGQQVEEKFTSEGWQVVATGRHPRCGGGKGTAYWLELDPSDPKFDGSSLDSFAPFAAVCWAKGANLNDSIYDVDRDSHMELYRANCLFIVVTLQKLLARKLLGEVSRLCVVSSIWQNIARQNKFSYCVTKSALQGLVLSAAADLAAEGHLINAVLPGALDTPMTRRNLSPEQINLLSTATKFNRLSSLDDVANLVFYLCSPHNTGITGQFIAADLGFSHVRIL